MTDKPRLADARRLADAATEGPWYWRNTLDPLLLGERSKAVMTFARMGMQGAQPQFRGPDGYLIDAGRENLYDFPDARFIAASRQLVPAMEQALRAVLALHMQGFAYGVPVCMTCSQVKDADEWDDPNDDPIPSWLPYPCPTIRAITAHLDIEP